MKILRTKQTIENKNVRHLKFVQYMFPAFYSCGHNRLHKRVYRGRYQIICQRNVIHKKSYCGYNPP